MDDTRGTRTERVSSATPNLSNEPKCQCRACYNSERDDEVFEKPSKSWNEMMAEDVGVSAYGPI